MPCLGLGSFNALLMFRRFRLNVIRFLWLPRGVTESTLRDAIERSSLTLLASYEERAARTRSISRFRASTRLVNRSRAKNQLSPSEIAMRHGSAGWTRHCHERPVQEWRSAEDVVGC